MDKLVVVILAAGKGTRMKSNITKVCHKVGNKTMIEHVVNTSYKLTNNIVVVVSKENIEDIRKTLEDTKVRLKIQYEQLGTGHAVMSAMPCCDKSENMLILLGDVPLISDKTLNKVINTNFDAVIIGFRNYDSSNKFGRIITKEGRVSRIVEYLDATEEERKITLCNSGMLWMKSAHAELLYEINNNNKKGEYYLTDLIEIMANKDLKIGFLEASAVECMGVNSPEELKQVNNFFNRK